MTEPFDVEAAEAECRRLIAAFPGDHPGVALAQDLLRLAQMWREEKAERGKAEAWVADLQSGRYVNCVYCGHRHGPGETTPVSMADALKAHIEKCDKHPLRQERQRAERMTDLARRLAKAYERLAGKTDLSTKARAVGLLEEPKPE